MDTAIDGSAGDADFLRTQIMSIRRQKDILYAERAGYANREVQIRILLEMVDQMNENSTADEHSEVEGDGSCRDYEDFFRRTAYRVPDGPIEDGKLARFGNDMVIRCPDSIVVQDDGYDIRFKARIEVKIER